MKKILFILVCMLAVVNVNGQTWSNLDIKLGLDEKIYNSHYVASRDDIRKIEEYIENERNRNWKVGKIIDFDVSELISGEWECKAVKRPMSDMESFYRYFYSVDDIDPLNLTEKELERLKHKKAHNSTDYKNGERYHNDTNKEYLMFSDSISVSIYDGKINIIDYKKGNTTVLNYLESTAEFNNEKWFTFNHENYRFEIFLEDKNTMELTIITIKHNLYEYVYPFCYRFFLVR